MYGANLTSPRSENRFGKYVIVPEIQEKTNIKIK